MKLVLKVAILLSVMFATFQANAWVYGENVSIVEVLEWNGDGPVFYKTSAGDMCYVPAEEKNMYSLVLSLFATGMKADIHCFDAELEYNAYTGHKTHRIIAKRN